MLEGERAMTEFSGGSAEPKNYRLAPTRLCFILTTSDPTSPPFPPHPSQDVIPADVATGMLFYSLSASNWMQLITPCSMLTCAQRAVAPIAATLLAGSIALYPKKTAFAEEPREDV